MNILWLAPIPLIDESDTHPAPWVMTLAEAIIQKGNKLTIVNYNTNIKNNIMKIKYKNINIIYIKTPKLKLDFLTLYQLKIYRVRKFIKSIIHNFDILHIHGTEHQYEIISKGLDIPKVISIQGIMGEYIKYIPIKRFKQYLEWKLSALYETRNLSRNFDFSCRTHWDSGYIKSKNPRARIYMIWEMIRKEFFSDHFSLKKDNILFVGGKNPIKGLKELLIAYDNSIQGLGFKLIVLGRCTLHDIKNMIKEMNLQNIDLQNIDCRGMQDVSHIISTYDDSYCLIHPTYIDNSPNSICEAQISGLPVIASNVGGVSSLIEDNLTGILVENIKDIELAVLKLYNNEKLRDFISKNSIRIARARHNPNDITKQTLIMYNDVIKRGI